MKYRNQEKKENLDFLFNWDSISETGNKRLAQYLIDESGWPYDLLEVRKSPNDRSLSCLFGLEDFDGNLNVEIKISHDEQSAEVIFTEIHDTDVLKESKLIIKKKLDERYVYRKGSKQVL